MGGVGGSVAVAAAVIHPCVAILNHCLYGFPFYHLYSSSYISPVSFVVLHAALNLLVGERLGRAFLLYLHSHFICYHNFEATAQTAKCGPRALLDDPVV